MYPPQFEYLCPNDLESALKLLEEYGDEAKVLAGGQSLIPMMKLRLAGPRFLIDINHVAALKGFQVKDDAFLFGALTRYAEIEESNEIAQKLPILKDAAAVTADVQVRNRGTIGGSLVHSDPAGDWAPPFLALDARAIVQGPEGKRTMSVEELFQDAYSPDLSPNELLTHIVVPLESPATTGAYLKFEKRAGDFAAASVAVQLRLDEGGRCQHVRVALGALGATAVRGRETEKILTGQLPTTAVIEKAAKAIQGAIDPFEDTRGSVDYKRHLAEVIFARAFQKALIRGQSSIS